MTQHTLLFEYWRAYYAEETLFTEGVLAKQHPAVHTVSTLELDDKWQPPIPARPNATVLVAPLVAESEGGTYVVPLWLRFYAEGEKWVWQDAPQFLIPFGLFDANTKTTPLSTEREYRASNWARTVLPAGATLTGRVLEALGKIYPSLTKTKQKELQLTIKPFGIWIALEEYLETFPLLATLLKAVETNPSFCAQHFLHSEQGTIPKTEIVPFVAHLAHRPLTSEAITALKEALTLPEGHLFPLVSPIGTQRLDWTMALLANSWHQHQLMGQPFSALLVTSSETVEAWLSHFQEANTVYQPWDPASRLLMKAGETIGAIDWEVREASYLLAAGCNTLQDALRLLSQSLEYYLQGVEAGEVLIKKYQATIVPLEGEFSSREAEELHALYEADSSLEIEFDVVSEILLEWEALNRSRHGWFGLLGRKVPARKVAAFLQKAKLPESLSAGEISKFLGGRLHDIRMARTEKVARIAELVDVQNRIRAFQHEWQKWWDHFLGGAFPTVPPAGLIEVLQQAQNDLRKRAFFALWHYKEAHALLEKEKPVVPPLLYWVNQDALLDPTISTEWVKTVDWVILDNAQAMPLLEGVCWLALGKRALVLGDSDQYVRLWAKDTESDYIRLFQAGLIQAECDFEEWEFQGLLASRSSVWDRTVAWYGEAQGTPHRLFSQITRAPGILDFPNQTVYRGALRSTSALISLFAHALQLWHMPGECIKTHGQYSNETQANAILERLQELEPLLTSIKGLQHGIAIVTPFIRQQILLKKLLAEHYPKEAVIPAVLLPHELMGQIYELVIVSIVVTADTPKPHVFDEGLAFWNTVCLSARLALCIAGDEDLFDMHLHTPTGKLAKFIQETVTLPA